jgi:hypothetical protein
LVLKVGARGSGEHQRLNSSGRYSDNDLTSIAQIRDAFDHYKAVAGLLVTSGETLGVELQAAIEKLKTDGKTVAVLHGEELYRLALHVLASDTRDEGA